MTKGEREICVMAIVVYEVFTARLEENLALGGLISRLFRRLRTIF